MALVVLAGCGGGDDDPAYVPPRITKEQEPLPPGQAQPATPATAATLVRIPNSAAAQRRLGYVNAGALQASDLPVPDARVVGAVLGASATPEQVLVGTRAITPAEREPARSALIERATSYAQSCLGDTLAQTLLGPQTMGDDAALGVGLVDNQDPPAGLKLRVCGAAHFRRDLRAFAHALERRFPQAVVQETETGPEREVVIAGIPVRALDADELVELLAGGPRLRALAWR